MTYLPLVGYTILLRDLLAPLAEVALGRTLDGVARNLMISILVVLVSVFHQASCWRVCVCHSGSRGGGLCLWRILLSAAGISVPTAVIHMQHGAPNIIAPSLRCRVKLSNSLMHGCTCFARPAAKTKALIVPPCSVSVGHVFLLPTQICPACMLKTLSALRYLSFCSVVAVSLVSQRSRSGRQRLSLLSVAFATALGRYCIVFSSVGNSRHTSVSLSPFVGVAYFSVVDELTNAVVERKKHERAYGSVVDE